MKQKVLMIMNSLNCGGEENFVMNLYRCINRDKLQVDFLVADTNELQFFEKEIIENGDCIYKVPGKNKNFFLTMWQTYRIVKNGHYEVVHRHSDNSLMVFDLCAAALGGASVRIAHSHSSDTSSTKMKVLHYICRPFLNMISTEKYACGSEAGKWLFGNNKFRIINNGILVERFRYNDEMRVKMREQIHVGENTVLLGHVGRFDAVKNHVFLINVFEKLCQLNTKEFKLILVGDGVLKEKIKGMVCEKKLDDRILFIDKCNNVNEWLQAVDIFVFPSLYEGLPLSVVEAQASGTRCLVSDRVSKRVSITPLVDFMTLDAGVDQWANKIDELSKAERKMQNAAEMVIESGYDIKQIAVRFEDTYGK